MELSSRKKSFKTLFLLGRDINTCTSWKSVWVPVLLETLHSDWIRGQSWLRSEIMTLLFKTGLNAAWKVNKIHILKNVYFFQIWSHSCFELFSSKIIHCPFYWKCSGKLTVKTKMWAKNTQKVLAKAFSVRANDSSSFFLIPCIWSLS